MINPDILTAYADKVYGYAYTRTYSREEAEELAQEILFTALRSPRILETTSYVNAGIHSLIWRQQSSASVSGTGHS